VFFKKRDYNYKIQPTYLISNKSELMFINLCILLISCLFYSTGSFGFLNIFGIRRELQIFLILGPLLLNPVIFKNFPELLKEPIFLFVLIKFIVECIIYQRFINIFDSLTTILIVGILLSVRKEYSDKILKLIIIAAAIFSTMAIVEAIIVFFEPDLIMLLNNNYCSLTSANKVEILHPLGLLGFTVGQKFNFLGHDFVRFRSFAAEPSVLVYSFFCPGVLALSYRGYIKILSIPILFFSICLAQSAIIWLSLSLGIMAWGLFILFKGRVRLILMLTICIISMFFIVIYFVEIPNFMMKVMQFLDLINKQYSPFNKYSSGVVRFGAIKNYLALAKQYPFFGVPLKSIAVINLPMGLLLYSCLHFGIIGLTLMVAISHNIFKLAIYCFSLYKGIIGLMAAILYGTFIQVLCFSDYGWTGISGFLMIILLINKLKMLIHNNAM